MSERPRWVGDAVTLLAIAGLFGAVYLLPPDTSLAEMQRAGVLGVCVPALYPPLVTGKPDAPGFDVEYVQAIAKRLGVRMAVSANAAMARDFNPRAWNVTRAQCQMLAGGVVVSDATRSFLDVTPPRLETGWAMVAAEIPGRLDGVKVGVYTGLAGLDRIGLSRFLRGANASVEIMPSAEALADALRSGRVQAGVSEALMARQIAGTLGMQVAWMPAPLVRYPVAFGLWKGDLTLKRRLVAVIEALEGEGLTRELAGRYRIAPMTSTLGVSP
jgi:polar amino acid transport system substrate-binding protein/cystine transport system substrate-binding protein/membrane-bound lytic murein transglycosylase F